MAIQGKLLLGGVEYAPLNLYGVGVFAAFSGNGAYRNKGACGAIKGDGPLPPGKYWIVERGAGGIGSWVKAKTQDSWNRIWNGAEFDRDEWFALYKDDWGIDDGTWINDVYRGLFRLHPGVLSEGCITIASNADFAIIRNALLKTKPMQVPCMRSLMARGWIEVINCDYINTCP
jgi:hypothetical protein